MQLKSSAVGTIAAGLLLAGSLAWGGESRELWTGAKPADDGGHPARVAQAPNKEDGVVDLERKYPELAPLSRSGICGTLGPDDKCRPRPVSAPSARERYNRSPGFCLPYPILGRTFCW